MMCLPVCVPLLSQQQRSEAGREGVVYTDDGFGRSSTADGEGWARDGGRPWLGSQSRVDEEGYMGRCGV
jgi:hypothetical protein